MDPEKDSRELNNKSHNRNGSSTELNRQFKKELVDIFQRFGYLDELKDHEVKIKITSGNIAWININSIETIK